MRLVFILGHEYPMINFTALSHIEPPINEDEAPFFVTEDGAIGVMFEMPMIDSESPQFESAFSAITTLISRLKPGATIRVIQKASLAKETRFRNSRDEALLELGWMENKIFISVESKQMPGFGFFDWSRALRGKPLKSLSTEYLNLKSNVDFVLIRELGGVALEESKLCTFFPSFKSDTVVTSSSIDTAQYVIGVLRLTRQSVHALSPDTLSILRERLIAPYEISVSIKKLRPVRTQYILERKRGHLSTSTDTLAARSYQQTDEIAAETTLSGKGLVEIEWLLTLKRRSESELREDLEASHRALAPLGDVYIEVQGIAPSFAATIPGSKPHHTFLELDDIASYYLPLQGRGESCHIENPHIRATPFHRRDGSLYFFDLWRKGYDGANCIINGRRGKGKSVLANLISTALLNDPEIRLIKVDVGGSYTKECELARGKQVQFNLSEPSGLNPFALLNQSTLTEDVAVILSGFLSTLILESREIAISKEMQGAVEKTVLCYAESHPTKPSLSDFLGSVRDFPRLALLERFGLHGIFANVLKEQQNGGILNGTDRYVYFNFERLQNAANEDFAQAVMASVIASVNMEVLRAGDARRGAKHKVVFFADETPFFIQRNGRFFKLTTANFRKFGHATILIAQTTQDFVLPKEDGQSDYGILINSPIRFFYQVDDDPEEFARRFNLTPRQLEEIQNLGRSDEYREVFFQDELGGRVLRVAVTREEYWRVTSSRQDNERLHALLNAVPGLKLKEAIRCLASA